MVESCVTLAEVEASLRNRKLSFLLKIAHIYEDQALPEAAAETATAAKLAVLGMKSQYLHWKPEGPSSDILTTHNPAAQPAPAVWESKAAYPHTTGSASRQRRPPRVPAFQEHAPAQSNRMSRGSSEILDGACR
jgi:hypothetical protein